jgi:hypothetical protein
MVKCERSWVVTHITPGETGYEVWISVNGDPPHNTHETCAEFGVAEYMSRKENGIIRRGLTASGRDKRPR